MFGVFFVNLDQISPPGVGGEVKIGHVIVFDIESTGAVTAYAGGALRGPNASIG